MRKYGNLKIEDVRLDYDVKELTAAQKEALKISHEHGLVWLWMPKTRWIGESNYLPKIVRAEPQELLKTITFNKAFEIMQLNDKRKTCFICGIKWGQARISKCGKVLCDNCYFAVQKVKDLKFEAKDFING